MLPKPIKPIKEPFPYAKVEAAAVRAYGITADKVGTFRGRLSALQKANLFGADMRPGKGVPLQYLAREIHKIVFALELTELGLPPAVILRLVNDFWDSRLGLIFGKAEHAIEHPTAGGDVVLILGGVSLLTHQDNLELAVPNINHTTKARLMARLEFAIDDKSLPARAVMVNLSARLRRFHNALDGRGEASEASPKTKPRAKK
jgi:hypothetical protein